MSKSKRIRKHRKRFANQCKPPLSLPALGTLVYGGSYCLLAMFLVVTWSPSNFTTAVSLEFSLLATYLCVIHGGWLVLLVLNLLIERLSMNTLHGKEQIGEWCAIVVAGTLLASSLLMAAAIPAPSEIQQERTFNFRFDSTEKAWFLESNKED